MTESPLSLTLTFKSAQEAEDIVDVLFHAEGLLRAKRRTEKDADTLRRLTNKLAGAIDLAQYDRRDR